MDRRGSATVPLAQPPDFFVDNEELPIESDTVSEPGGPIRRPGKLQKIRTQIEEVEFMKGITAILFPLLVILLGVSCSPAPEVDPAPEAGAPPQAEADPIPCYLTSNPIEIDGRPDEAAWEQAPEIPLRFDGVGNPVSPTRASARFLWDGKELFVAMTAQDRDVGSTLTGRDARLWEEDVLELFIKPLESSPLYYEFEFSPSNQIFDAYFVKRGSPLDEATAWNSGLRVAVAVDGTLNNPEDDDRGWSLELALPLADLHHAGNSVPKQERSGRRRSAGMTTTRAGSSR